MKRDWDLIRAILILTEAQLPGELVRDLSSLGEDDANIVEHIRLARDSGLLEARILEANRGAMAAIIRLTPRGHDFLEQARQPVLWIKAKKAVLDAGAGASMEVLKAALNHLALAALAKVTLG